MPGSAAPAAVSGAPQTGGGGSAGDGRGGSSPPFDHRAALTAALSVIAAVALLGIGVRRARN